MKMYRVIEHSSCKVFLRYRGYLREGEIALYAARPKQITIAAIQERVAAHYGIGIADMVSARRSVPIVRPRQLAMYLAKELTPKSLPQIGRKFGKRDHSTVHHAIERIAALRKTDKALDSDIRIIAATLAPQPVDVHA